MSKLVRKPMRLKEYDYSKPNYYFVTICTYKMKNLFGEIKNNIMIKNNGGKIVETTLLNTISSYKFLSLDNHVVMPNHLHAIVIINYDDELTRMEDTRPSTITISQLVCEFKSRALQAYVKAVKNNVVPRFNKKIWQRSFYDHIIRNEKDYQRVWQYINNNPQKWELDKYYNDES